MTTWAGPGTRTKPTRAHRDRTTIGGRMTRRKRSAEDNDPRAREWVCGCGQSCYGNGAKASHLRICSQPTTTASVLILPPLNKDLERLHAGLGVPCSVDGCPRTVRSNGMCAFHDLANRAQKMPVCSVVECVNAARSRGLCPAHYRRWSLYGDVHGHEYTPKNTRRIGPRKSIACRQCARERRRKSRQRSKP